MQERRNKVAAITLQLYVGGRRNAGQFVFIHAAALRGSLGAELKQQGPAAMETETAITPIWTCPFRRPQALYGGVGDYTYWWQHSGKKSSNENIQQELWKIEITDFDTC